MRCPCCDHSIPDTLVVQMAASINGRKGVGKTGGARKGAGRPRKTETQRLKSRKVAK